MELVKNIFFNTDKLIQNSVVKISYTGKFFEEGCEEVFIHYGFGDNWDYLNELKMDKTDLGFQIELRLIESNSLNFCFRNGNNEWDNNNNANYIFEIESPSMELIVTDGDYALDRPNRLRKSYLWNKKIRLAIYKIIRFVPKLLTGNYKRKTENQ